MAFAFACALGAATCGALAVLPGVALAQGAATSLLASPLRTPQDLAMDAARHPAEWLAFTDVRPGMQVLDIATGGGYTTQLLALAVGPTGKVYAQSTRPSDALAKRLAANPQANIVAVVRPFDDPAPPGVALDLVTLVLNYHDITYLPVDRAQMNQRIFAALKPGGHYVIVDHAARAGTGIADGKTLHRIDEATVITEVQAAGFRVDSAGAFLRNPADVRSVSSGDSPATSDRFVLRFTKPR